MALSASRGEPPISSYLPPVSGVGGPPPQYGPPNSRPGSSQDFGRGGSANSRSLGGNQIPQNTYGTPGEFGPSNGAGNQRGSLPQSGGFGSGPNQSRPNRLSAQYGAPQSGNDFSNQRGQGSQQSSSFRGSDRSGGAQQNLQSSYGPPSQGPSDNSRGFMSGSANSRGNSPSSSYGPPPSGNFNPRGKGSSNRGSNGNSGFESGNQAQRNIGAGRGPESVYGPPGNAMNINGFNNREQLDGGREPLSSYGVPEANQKSSNFGGDSNFEGESDVRDICTYLNCNNNYSVHIMNVYIKFQEPAKYEFSYDVDDSQTGTKFGHSEQRDGSFASGKYNVLLPDGRKQVVEYEAGQQGYKPQIRYEGLFLILVGSMDGNITIPTSYTNILLLIIWLLLNSYTFPTKVIIFVLEFIKKDKEKRST